MSNIIDKLNKKSNPPWDFSSYMETALYDSEIGYYTNERQKLGTEGDFYTSNHVHAVFAETFARFFTDVLEKEQLPPFLCEWGAGDGTFAYHTLSYLRRQDSTIALNLTYLIVEASPHHRAVLRDHLAEFKHQVKIYDCFEELKEDFPDYQGILFSNELLDAFPVHVVEQHKDGLKEVLIEESGKKLIETVKFCENKEIKRWMEQFGPQLPEGHRMEVNLEMKNWLTKVSSWLKKGMLVTVDYGYTNEELILPERKEGSIRGYRNHKMVKNPLCYPGEMDLTSHIQWDAYNQLAMNEGLEMVCRERQDQFLLKAGLFTFLQPAVNMNPFSEEFKKNRAIQSFVQPGGISTSFQVNIHGKGLNKTNEYIFFHEDPYQISTSETKNGN
jgi:SAM-dependent MidA family methyltransferase